MIFVRFTTRSSTTVLSFGNLDEAPESGEVWPSLPVQPFQKLMVTLGPL